MCVVCALDPRTRLNVSLPAAIVSFFFLLRRRNGSGEQTNRSSLSSVWANETMATALHTHSLARSLTYLYLRCSTLSTCHTWHTWPGGHTVRPGRAGRPGKPLAETLELGSSEREREREKRQNCLLLAPKSSDRMCVCVCDAR